MLAMLKVTLFIDDDRLFHQMIAGSGVRGVLLCTSPPPQKSVKCQFLVIMLVTVTNMSSDIALRILISRKRFSPRLSREICKEAFSRPFFLNKFLRTLLIAGVKRNIQAPCRKLKQASMDMLTAFEESGSNFISVKNVDVNILCLESTCLNMMKVLFLMCLVLVHFYLWYVASLHVFFRLQAISSLRK